MRQYYEKKTVLINKETLFTRLKTTKVQILVPTSDYKCDLKAGLIKTIIGVGILLLPEGYVFIDTSKPARRPLIDNDWAKSNLQFC